MSKIRFSSELSNEFINDLKLLIYFNPEQYKVSKGIETSIELYGLPEIADNNGNLKIELGDLEDVQTLYCMTEEPVELVGVVIFYRESMDNLTILHIAVKDDYTLSSSKGKSYIMFEMIKELKKLAVAIKGIKTITIMYSRDKFRKIKV